MPRFIPCTNDGTPIDTLTERQGRPAKYCSGVCRQAAYRARRREKRAAVAAAEAITRAAAEVPADLHARARWVRWTITRDGRTLPLQAHVNRAASSTDQRTWTDYDTPGTAPSAAGSASCSARASAAST